MSDSSRYGSDGLGPEPSPEVVDIRDTFFDDPPPATDPEVRQRIVEAIEKRTPAWRAKRGRS